VRAAAEHMASQEQKEVVELESRQSRIVLATTALGVAATLIGNIVQSSGLSVDADDAAERLVDRADSFSTIVAGSIVAGVGFLLLGGTLLFLFSAAQRRSELVRSSLKPMLIIGPVLLAISGVMTAVAFDAVASDFLNGGATTGDEAVDRAEELAAESGLLQFAAFAGLAGLAAFAFGIIYTALHAMRTGLLTRCWWTLGMAFGAAFLLSQFFGPIGFFGVSLWMVHVALQARGLWPGGGLPAWRTGTAVPWPDPGAPPPGPEPEEAAQPEDFEGAATEVPAERPARRDNSKKRKRKQRG